MRKRLLLLFVVMLAASGVVWAGFHFGGLTWHNPLAFSAGPRMGANIPSWFEAVEQVKADRGAGAYASVEVPSELRHYSDRHWFLATQVAEVEQHHVTTCQDFVELAALIERGEMVTLPAVTNTYILYGVGERANDKPFSRYQASPASTAAAGNDSPPLKGKELVARAVEVELYSEAQLNGFYNQFNERRAKLQTDVVALRAQSRGQRKETQKELQKQISEHQKELSSLDENKARIDQFYGDPANREKLFAEYQSLQTLAKNLAGRSFNLDQPNDRQQMKVIMLSALRPQALKILEEVAAAYQRQFNRPLPVSSLVRPQQYQHALSRVNRNAILIETPPHSTGLAFDIDYRYMSGAEQSFVMAELARLKREGRIEVIRERNANYHVFAFINGTRPNDELIAASLEKAGAPEEEEPEASDQKSEVKRQKVAKKGKAQPSKSRASGARTRKRR